MKGSKNRAASFDAGSEYSMDKSKGKEQITIRSSAARHAFLGIPPHVGSRQLHA